MKLYGEGEPAPNPRRVRIFLAEKGVDLPQERVPIREGAHKALDFLAKNSLGQLPVLELDDGTMLSESVSICRYLEYLYPDPPLFGRDGREAAFVDMWIRRVELQLGGPIGNIWRHAHPFTAHLLIQYKDFGESNRDLVTRAFAWLNGELAGKTWICGDDYTMADIAALTAIDFGRFINVDIPITCAIVQAWHDRASARPSAAA